VVDQDTDYPFPVHQLLQRTHPAYGLSLFKRGEDLLNALVTFEQLPSLVLLSYDKPSLESYLTLRVLKSSVAYQLIPVVVISRAASDQQISAYYQASANAFMRRALNADNFKRQLEATYRFWLIVGQRPTASATE
jgi:response regulator RpfG family c-di-GMP phosphodiesterase